MKTVIHINCALNRGSTGRIAEQIGMLAKNNGWNVYMVCGSPKHQVKSHLQTLQMVGLWGERWHALMSRALDNHGLANDYQTKKLIKKLEVIKPDIIHIHNLHGYYINYEILFKYLQSSNAKIVWTLHDCWPFTGHCAYFDYVGCEKWKDGCYKCPQKLSYPKSYIDRSSRNYNLKKRLFSPISNRITLVPVSNWLGGLVKQSFLKECNVQVIHNGIDLTTFKNADTISKKKCKDSCGIASDKKIILGCAAQWGKRKGFEDFMLLREKLGDSYAMIMVGLNEKELKQAQGKNIIAFKRTNSVSQLVELYSIADVFVNTTYQDNFPTTNLEALACGTPVITYRTGGSPESIDEKTGMIIDQGDIDGLVNACVLLADKSKHKSLDCRTHAEAWFDNQKRFEDYIRLYNNLLDINENIDCNNLLEQ